MLGQVLDDCYNIQEEVLSGSFTTLFKALDNSKNKPVFIQLFSEKAKRRSLELKLRFKREIEQVSSLNHPNLLKVISYSEDYLVLESFEGEPLSRYMSTPQDIDGAAEIILKLASGLDIAHQQNLLHQAIQPASILFNRQNQTLKLFNFGYYLLQDISRVTELAEIISIFGYLSPEASGILRRPVDIRSDIYSLGILFYQLLSSRLPYESSDISTLIHQHIATFPPLLSKFNSQISPVLEKIVLRLIAKEPQERYQSLSGLIEDLNEYLNQRKLGKKLVDFEIARSDRMARISFYTKLIGREKEMGILQNFLDKTKDGQGVCCAVFGEPGIGKSRLIDELRSYVHSLGGIFAGGKCYEYEFRTPYKVLSEAIDNYIDKLKRFSKEEQEVCARRIKEALGGLGGEAIKIVPNLVELIGTVPELVELESKKEKTRFLITVTNFLISLAAPDSPLLLFLDDLQWVDEGSLEVLEGLAGKLKNSSILLILSYRDNEVTPTHPLSQLISKIKSQGMAFSEVGLRPFSITETTTVVSQILMEKEDSILPLAEELQQRAKGNPFFALELLHSLVSAGAVYFKDNHYRFDPDKIKGVSLPVTLIDAVLKRMSDLSEENLQVISYASVMGKEIQFGLLTQLLQKPSEVILNSIEDGIRSQFLYRDITGRENIYFMHDRVREAFYKRVSEKERIPLHRHIASVLEEGNKDNPEPVIYELAHHFIQGKIDSKALQYSIPAARKAGSYYAYNLAISLYNAAKEILEKQDKKDSQEYIEVLENLGGMYRLALNFGESLEVLKICESLVPSAHKIHKARILSKIGETLLDKGELENSAKVLEESLKNLNLRLPTTKFGIIAGILREFIRQMLHYWWPKFFVRENYKAAEQDLIVVRLLARLDHIYFVFDMNKTLLSFLKGLNISEKLGPCSELAFSYSIGGGVWSGFPWFSRTFRDLDKGLKLALSLEDKIREGGIYAYTVYSCYLANKPKQGQEAALKAISLLKGIGEYWDLSLAYAFRNYNDWIAGDLKKARENAEEFLKFAKEINASQALSWAYFTRAKTLCFLGDVNEKIIADLDEAARLAKISMSRPDVIHSMAIQAFAYSRMKDYTHAIHQIEDVVKLLPTHYTKSVWILDFFPMGAQIYLDAILNTPTFSKGQRKQYLKRARWFCQSANFYSFFFKFIYGWTLQVNGTYWWLSGQKRLAFDIWKKAIKFLREKTEDKYRLASCLLEQASFLLQDNSNDKRGFEALLEAKQLFLNMGCKLDLERANQLLMNISSLVEVVESKDVLTQKRHLSTLISVTKSIGSVFVLDDLLSKILEYALKVTGAERGFIFLYQGKEDSLVLRLSKGLTQEFSGLAFSWDNYKLSLAFIKEIEKTKEALVASEDSSINPKIQQELKNYSIREALGVPLVVMDRPLGLIYLDNRFAAGTFGKDELELMQSFAVQASVSIENAFLVTNMVEQERLKQEMELGRDIQMSLLPQESPQVPGVKVIGFMNPAKEIGGDYYDFIELPEQNQLAVVIGDVSGKGVGAGLIMAMVKSTIHAVSQEELSPKKLLIRTNQLLHNYITGQKFVTLLYLKWSFLEKKLFYSSAGHEYIIVYRNQTRQVEAIKSGGFVLGIIPDIGQYLEDKEIELATKDKIILYTDGVTEARNTEEDLFGLQRFIQLIQEHGQNSAEDLILIIKDALSNFISTRDQYDDITLVVVEAE